jgi:two-component system phosphate regulon response regulator OmpR
MAERVLIIDDDARLAAMLADYLTEGGLVVTRAGDGESGLQMMAREQPDIIVLDLMMPGIDGLETCRRIRARHDVPILMLTAKGEETDRIVGLELGADDYLPKPFNPRELLARLRAILRRRHAPTRGRVIRFGQLEIDEDARIVRVRGEEKPLTSYQFDLLATFAEHAGRVLSRDQLLDLVRGAELEAFDRSIDVHISRIRAAIEDDPKRPRRILTVRGAGYVFARRQDGEG